MKQPTVKKQPAVKQPAVNKASKSTVGKRLTNSDVRQIELRGSTAHTAEAER